MKQIRYFLEFIVISILFIIFKIVGYKLASNFGYFLGCYLGPFFRSKSLINENLKKFDNSLNNDERKEIIKDMWGNYGRIFAEYPFMKNFRFGNLGKNIKIHGIEKLKNIKNDGPIIFISGHFSNFELMAMAIEKEGINLSAIYRPLNNKFLNIIMEFIRKNYICKNQIEKGVSGLRKALSDFKKGNSIALMIDQRVTEGSKINFFNSLASTTTIPAQFVKKFACRIQPVSIIRKSNFNFEITFQDQLVFKNSDTIENISLELNRWLEKQIIKNPSQWIWTHNRWK